MRAYWLVTLLSIFVGLPLCASAQESSDSTKVSLTEQEQQWISAHPVVTYSEVNWKPMSIIADGKMDGVMGDYLDLISKSSGIEFKFVAADSWPDGLKKFQDKEIDIVPGVGNSEQEKALGLISNPYSEYPLVIVGNESATFVNGPEDLTGMTLAIPKYYTSSNYIKENFPELTVRDTSSIKEALSLVSSGEADVFVGHKLVSIYNIEALYLKNLKIIGITEFRFLHSILVQNSDPELLSIINKVIDRISVKKKKQIYDEWITVGVEQPIDYSLLWKVIAVFAVIAAVGLLWIVQIRRQQRALSDSEARFRAVIDQLPVAMVLKDAEGRFTIVNKIFSEWFAKDDEEIVGKTSHDLYPKDVADRLRAIDLEIMESGAVIEEEVEEPFADGVIHTLLMSKFPILGPGGKAVAVGTIETDITERK